MTEKIGKVDLGKTGLKISAIGLGTGTFGREIDESTSWRIMDHAVENGITFFDTAEAYGGGIPSKDGIVDPSKKAERIIGNWLKQRGCRDDIIICTKISGGKGNPDAINKALEQSLEMLRTDHIDVYKMHSPDPNTPIAETLGAMASQVDKGLVRIIGCSNYSVGQMQDALDASDSHGYPRFGVNEPPYNLVHQQHDKDLFSLCRNNGIAITPHSPLGNGFLTGKYTEDLSKIPQGSRFDIAPSHINLYFHSHGWSVLKKLRRKSVELDIPMVKLAMAWSMTHPDVTAVLVGARETTHVDNAIEAFNEGLNPELRLEMSSWN